MIRRLWPLGVVVAIALVPLVDRNAAHIDFLVDAGVFMLLALGLNVVVGFAGLLDLGYAAFFAIGSYAYAKLASPHFGVHVPFWVMLFLGAAIAGLFGLVLGAPTLRLRGDYLAIVTLGFGEIVPQTFLNLTPYTNGPNGIGLLDRPVLFGYRFGFDPLPYFYLTFALIVVALVLSRNVRDSRIGRAWIAIREDELAARCMGVDATRAKLAAFALGASFSGVAGVLYASKLQLVSPDQFQFSVSILVLSMLVLGGMGSVAGAIAGAFILAFVAQVALPQATSIAASIGLHVDLTNYRFMLYGGILVLVMLLRPSGLIPSGRRRAELRGAADDARLLEREDAEYAEAPT
jgi:branched-chain amino acid transport system permease protein